MVPALVNSMEKKESRQVQPVTLTQLLGNMVSTGRHVWMTAEGQGTAGRKEKSQCTKQDSAGRGAAWDAGLLDARKQRQPAWKGWAPRIISTFSKWK